MLKLKNIIIATFCLFLFSSIIFVGDVFAAREQGTVFRAYLYYDNGKIFIDREEVEKAVVLHHGFIESEDGDYRAQIVSFSDSVLMDTVIDINAPEITDMPADFVQPSVGKINIELPYFTNAKEIQILSKDYISILTIDVSSLAKCNENKVCEVSRMENPTTCSFDCIKTSYIVGREGFLRGVWPPIILVIVLIGGAVTFVVLRRKRA